MSLPAEELGAALQDGIVLCHLANHVRPRAVASVHVPSPGVVGYISKELFMPHENFLLEKRNWNQSDFTGLKCFFSDLTILDVWRIFLNLGGKLNHVEELLGIL
jgi:hypothetical protein